MAKSRSRTSGKTIISARRKSLRDCSAACRKISSPPPTWTVIRAPSRVKAGEMSASRVRASVTVPAMRAMTRACLPSFPRMAGELPRDQYEKTSATPSCPASSRSRARPSEATASPSTVPSLAVTISSTLGVPASNSFSRKARVVTDSEPGVSKRLRTRRFMVPAARTRPSTARATPAQTTSRDRCAVTRPQRWRAGGRTWGSGRSDVCVRGMVCSLDEGEVWGEGGRRRFTGRGRRARRRSGRRWRPRSGPWWRSGRRRGR